MRKYTWCDSIQNESFHSNTASYLEHTQVKETYLYYVVVSLQDHFTLILLATSSKSNMHYIMSFIDTHGEVETI
jgi:hypothetical protein